MNPFRAFVERLADRVHARPDMRAHAQGVTVERLSWGRRRISHPALPGLLDEYRLRRLRNGLDPLDRALMDDATARLYADTVRRANQAGNAPASWAPAGHRPGADPAGGDPAGRVRRGGAQREQATAWTPSARQARS